MVVGSSLTCSWDYLGLFVAVKSELWRWAPCGDDDRQHVVCLVVFRGASLA